MLARILPNASAAFRLGHLRSVESQLLPALASTTQTRHAATLKALAARMRTIKNMQKITKAMKMVAAAKLKHDQVRMEKGMPFARPAQSLMERLPRESNPGTMTILGMTSDKGLCGGVNSAVAKLARKTLIEEEAKGNQVKYMAMGMKGTLALKRLYGDRYTTTFEDMGKIPWNFTQASVIAERLIVANPLRLQVCYNTFKSVVAYNPVSVHVITKQEAKGVDKVEWSKALDVYTFEPSIFEVWDDLHEFYYASVIYGGYLNNQVTEQSQRMSAMENASKNAGEILEKVTLIYNRARQAKITTELCEIIGGASAV